MKKLTVLVSAILLLAVLAGCSTPANTLDAVPEGARHVFTHEVEDASGRGVTYGSWLSSQDIEGTLVVEILCTAGSAKDVKLEYSTGKGGGSAFLGNFSRQSTIIQLDDFHVPGGNYTFKIGSLSGFSGTLNIYLVPA